MDRTQRKKLLAKMKSQKYRERERSKREAMAVELREANNKIKELMAEVTRLTDIVNNGKINF